MAYRLSTAYTVIIEQEYETLDEAMRVGEGIIDEHREASVTISSDGMNVMLWATDVKVEA